MRQFKPTLFNAFYTPDTAMTDLQYSGFNHGYNTHYAWHLPLKSGAIASTLNLVGTGTIAASALAVKLAEADLTGSGVLAATGSLIVQALAAISGSGTISAANLQAFLQAIASLTGSGTVSSASLTAFGALIASVTGSGTAATSTLTAIGELIADIVVTGTGLSTANVASAVWGALATANNVSGTMGEKVNNAASAGDPWGTALPGAYAAGTAGDILGNLLSTLPPEIRTELTPELAAVIIARKILTNKTVTNPTTGIMTVYEDDGTTVMFTANVFEDVAGTQPYRGQGADRKDGLS